MRIISAIHKLLKTNQGFRETVRDLPFVELGQPIQTAKYEPNAISILENIPGIKRGTLYHSHLDQRKRKFSVRNLTGVYAGKTPRDIEIENFLDYGRTLKPASEYTLHNRIGYTTDEDFQTNCTYLQDKLEWIASTEDGIPIIVHRKWDDTYYLVNCDGGNHFAAVYRQCIEQDRDFTFDCRIEHQTLDVKKCQTWLNHRAVLILPTVCADPLGDLLAKYNSKITPFHYEFQPRKTVLNISWHITPRAKELYQIIVETLPPTIYFDLGQYIRTKLPYM